MKSYSRALTIAGSDSGGGAGIQADLKTFSALGCFGMSVITALTAQNTRVVTGILPVPPEFIGDQIDAVMEDIGTDAVLLFDCRRAYWCRKTRRDRHRTGFSLGMQAGTI